MAKKPVTVFITKTKHKKQPFTVRIEQGKTDTILSQRYVNPFSAKRGALRKLRARTQHAHPFDPAPMKWVTPEMREIRFSMN